MVQIRLVRHREKRGELLDLFRVSFGHDMSAELWDWKYLRNPLASADPEVIVAMDNGKIVGARPLLLAEMWLGDEKVKAAQPCDTMVHPQYRRQGIFSRMNQFAIEYLKENSYTFFYNFPGPMPRPGYLRGGWRIVSTTETLFQATNPQKLISYKLKNKLLGNEMGFFYDKFLNPRGRNAPSPGLFQIGAFDRLTDELKQVDALRDRSAINLVRSESWLLWRFDQHPEHGYRYFVAKKGHALWGYAVASVQEQPNGLVNGMVVKSLAKDKDSNCFQALISKCLDELKRSECDFISVWAFSQPNLREELVKYLGFKSSSGFPYHRFWGHGYFVGREIDEQVLRGIDIYSAENWRVTYAYPDTT